ncbi:MAG: glutaredoxin [Cyclobacteriaceae bacterium]|nr:glutaredoxin [Cyclobacteriaceae bacterium]
MKLRRDEMVLFLDCTSSTHKKTRAYAHSISGHIQEYTFVDFKFTKSIWRDILTMLAVEPKHLLNKADPKYQKEIKGKAFDEDGWLNILINNPCLIRAPIALMHDKAVFCVSPKDIYKLQSAQEAQF